MTERKESPENIIKNVIFGLKQFAIITKVTKLRKRIKAVKSIYSCFCDLNIA